MPQRPKTVKAGRLVSDTLSPEGTDTMPRLSPSTYLALSGKTTRRSDAPPAPIESGVYTYPALEADAVLIIAIDSRGKAVLELRIERADYTPRVVERVRRFLRMKNARLLSLVR